MTEEVSIPGQDSDRLFVSAGLKEQRFRRFEAVVSAGPFLNNSVPSNPKLFRIFRLACNTIGLSPTNVRSEPSRD